MLDAEEIMINQKAGFIVTYLTLSIVFNLFCWLLT